MAFVYTSKSIEKLERLYSDMTLRQLRIIDYVLNNQGCLMMDVVLATNLPQSVCSRTIRLMLSDAINSKNIGLLLQRDHPTDGRKKQIYPSDLLLEIIHLIE